MSQEENDGYSSHDGVEILRLSKINSKLLFEKGSGFFEDD